MICSVEPLPYLAINLQTAKFLFIDVPSSLVASVEGMIE
jgi:hypothetical protein